MEQITNLLLPFGNLTLTVLGLVLLALLLAGIYQLGIILIRLMLALDTEDAPEVKMENKLLSFNPFYKEEYINRVEKIFNGWGVVAKYQFPVINDYYTRSGYGVEVTEDCIKECCVHKNKEDALEISKRIYGTEGKSFSVGLLKISVLICLSLDLLLLSLQTFFFPTVIISGMMLFVYGVRTLAKKVYKNTKNINSHEERIGNLEEK